MKHVEGNFQGFNNLELYYQSWHPILPIQAVVVMVHGLGGHSGLFVPAVKYLLGQGYEVYGFDLRGHGRSPGQRGHINTWAEYREDLHAFIKMIQSQRPGCPCFLWGHSLGGTIALDYALHYPSSLQGLVAAAPALRQVSVPRTKLAIGWLFSRFIPRFSLKLGFKQSVCSADSLLCNAFLEDPLRHEYGSARLATEFFNTVDWIQTHAGDLQVPLLTLHGGADQVAFPEASRAFFQQVTFPDKEYLEYPDYYHDLYIDLGYQTVLTDFGNWLNRHLEGSACQSLRLWA